MSFDQTSTNPDAIVRCMGCQHRVRLRVTKIQLYGEDEIPQRWCFECLRAIDDYTAQQEVDMENQNAALEDRATNILLEG